MRSRLPRSARAAVLLSAAAAATVAAALIATAGSAQTQPTTLRLVGTAQGNIGFGPDRMPRQGDRIGGGSRITGDDTGVSRTVCTRIARKALCALQIQLSKGKLSAQGLVPDQTDRTPIAITGGTGAYDGAGGTALATQVSDTRTRLDITFSR